MRVKVSGKEILLRPDATPLALEPLAPQAGLQPIVNGQALPDFARGRPLRDGDVVEYAARDVVKAAIGPSEQRMALYDLMTASDYFRDLYGVEFDAEFDADEEYCIINNFQLPRSVGYKRSSIPLLLPLSGYPIYPPPGLHVPTDAPDTTRLSKSYTVYTAGPAPYSRTHNLTAQGWAWLCLRKKTAQGDGWQWDYTYTTGGPDTIKNYLVIFDAKNREA